MNRPILFNTEMVKAILDGRKTQTRRIIKPQPSNPRWNNIGWIGWDDGHGYRMKSPCEAGDVLWVREAWAEMPYGFVYRADDEKTEGWDREDRWRPSIHMPKQAARIFLRVTDVRVERLQDITAAGIRAEGLSTLCAFVGDMEIALLEWRNLWNNTVKTADREIYGWEANPWVFVIAFERCEMPERFRPI